MDVSVDYLLERMTRRLPAALPLGLVHVVGQVGQLRPRTAPPDPAAGNNGRMPVRQFELTAGEAHLTCVTLPAAGSTAWITPGENVRVGGHLVFDGRRAAYVLLAQSVMRLTPDAVASQHTEQRQAIRDTLTTVKKRAEAAEMDPGELPAWVQTMAREALKPAAPPSAPSASAPKPEPVAPSLPLAATAVPGRQALTPELVNALSAAMDSDEEVELTQDMLARYGYTPEMETAVASSAGENTPALRSSYRPPPERQDTDWLVILLIITFFVLTVTVLVAVVLLLFI